MVQTKEVYHCEVKNEEDRHYFFAHCRWLGEIASQQGYTLVIARETEVGWIDLITHKSQCFKSIPQLEMLKKLCFPTNYRIVFRK
jgi:hypothetical protein